MRKEIFPPKHVVIAVFLQTSVQRFIDLLCTELPDKLIIIDLSFHFPWSDLFRMLLCHKDKENTTPSLKFLRFLSKLSLLLFCHLHFSLPHFFLLQSGSLLLLRQSLQILCASLPGSSS